MKRKDPTPRELAEKDMEALRRVLAAMESLPENRRRRVHEAAGIMLGLAPPPF